MSPTYSLIEIYRLVKSISNLEQFSILEQVLGSEEDRYDGVEFHNITCLITAKKFLLLNLDAIEYILVEQTAKKKG